MTVSRRPIDAAPLLGVGFLLAFLAPAAVFAAASPDAKVLAAVRSERADALGLLRDVVNVDSGTGDASGGAKVGAIVADRLRALGADVRTEPAEAAGLPDNVVGVLKGDGRGKILIIAHLDTVFGPGTAETRPFSINGDRAHGPGVGDEKGGVVEALAALKILHDLGYRKYASITFLLDDSEERGSPGSTALIKRLALDNDVEFNMEPGDPPDALTVWRKGSASLRIVVKGRAAHAGMAPQDGRNAAVELIHQLNAIAGRFPTFGDGITVNLTLMRAGERNNVIPDAAEATLNVRFRRADDFKKVLAAVDANAKSVAVPDTAVEVIHDTSFPPLVEEAAQEALAARAQAIYGELGKTIGLSGNGGASESALAQSVGVPALDGLGFVGGDFHTDHEWIDLKSVEPRLYLFTRLLMEAGAQPPARTGG